MLLTLVSPGTSRWKCHIRESRRRNRSKSRELLAPFDAHDCWGRVLLGTGMSRVGLVTSCILFGEQSIQTPVSEGLSLYEGTNEGTNDVLDHSWN